MRRQLTSAFLLVGTLGALMSPVVFAQQTSTLSGQPPAPSGTQIDLMLAVWVGGAIVGGVVTALTFIFRLFLRSRDSTEAALNTRITALETALSDERKESAGISAKMIDLLQGAVRDSSQAMTELTKVVTEQSKVLTELVGSIEENRKHGTDEHTRILGAVGSIVAAYDRRTGN